MVMEKDIVYMGGLKGPFSKVYRIIFGEPILSKDKKTRLDMEYEEPEHLSGSVGFLDMAICPNSIPTKKTRKGNPSCWKHTETLTMLAAGVEPEYRRKGYGTKLVKEGEKFATERGIGTVVIFEANNVSYEMVRGMGYEPVDSSSRTLFRELGKGFK